MVSERPNSPTVCCGDRCARLSNHFDAISSALAPTEVDLPSTSTSTRTKTCAEALIATAPNRNGFVNGTGRSKNEMSRTAIRGGMAFLTSIQRALGEEMLTDALYQFGEHRIGHGIERTRARQRHLVDRRDRTGPLGHDQYAIGEEHRFRNRMGDQQHGLAGFALD